MKSSTWTILNSALAALAMGAGLLVLLDVIHPPDELQSDSSHDPASVKAGAPDRGVVRVSSPATEVNRTGEGSPPREPRLRPASPAAGETLSPEAIADAFGWAEAIASPHGGPPTRRVADAPWLSLIGSVTQADGESSYFFKNERTGGVLRLSPAQSNDGWGLEINEEGDFLIERDGDLYRVRGKR